MRSTLLTTALAFSLLSGIAAAQTTSSESSTTSIIAPPVGTLSTTRTQRTIDSNGTETQTNRTTYRNETGVADDVHTTTITHPPVSNPTTTITTITR